MKIANGPAGDVARYSAEELASDQLLDGCAHRCVEDFFCSHGIPFFAAVVSTCRVHVPRIAARSKHDVQSCPTVVTLVGELDCATASLLQTCMARIDGNIEVECSDLDFVGAQGLRHLMDARARCERAGATFEFVAPTPMLRRLLLIAGVSSA